MSHWKKKTVEVRGLDMTYVEHGEGRPIVFLHGNPTSSWLWRNILPALTGHGRCLAPDLIGMGDSAKLPDSGPDRYRFVEHREYLDGLLAALGADDDVVFVVHDWGSALAFDWGNRHRDRVKGYAYMEALVRPLAWDEFPAEARPVFEAFRSPAGEKMVLDNNLFVERVLPGSILRRLTDAEMAEYRRPFRDEGEARRPTLTWPRQIPLDGEPADVVAIVQDYADWLAASAVPKLFVNAEPGALLVGAQREFCRVWNNQTEVTVKGSHFVQEDSPAEIAAAIDRWLQGL